jgi:hypothetical protein
VRIAPDSRGDLSCQRLGLTLGLRESTYEGIDALWLRFIDGTGTLVPTETEAAEAAEAALAAARGRADAEKDRADAEKDRADAEKDRADAERRRAEDAERRRAEDAERRLAALEARSKKS